MSGERWRLIPDALVGASVTKALEQRQSHQSRVV